MTDRVHELQTALQTARCEDEAAARAFGRAYGTPDEARAREVALTAHRRLLDADAALWRAALR